VLCLLGNRRQVHLELLELGLDRAENAPESGVAGTTWTWPAWSR